LETQLTKKFYDHESKGNHIRLRSQLFYFDERLFMSGGNSIVKDSFNYVCSDGYHLEKILKELEDLLSEYFSD